MTEFYSDDGRPYPEHLKPYEVYDKDFMPLLSYTNPLTFDEIIAKTNVPHLHAALMRWLSSAEWRKLIVRYPPNSRRPRAYTKA